MPVSTQLIEHTQTSIIRTHLKDIEGKNVHIHWLKFIYDHGTTFNVNIENCTDIDYHMSSIHNEKMNHSENWLQMFQLPIFITDYAKMYICNLKEDITCVYAWTPCDQIYPQLYYECFIERNNYFQSDPDDHCYDFISDDPIQEDWLKESCEMIRYTPWHWKSKSPGYPFKENDGDIIPIYIRQSEKIE